MTSEAAEEKSLCGFLSLQQLEDLKELTLPEVELNVVTQLVHFNPHVLSGHQSCVFYSVIWKISNALDLEDYLTSLQSGIILDYYVSGISFAREKMFTSPQIDYLFSAMALSMEKCKEGHTMEDNISALREFLLSQTVLSTEATSPVKDGLLIVDYLMETFFQHYRLYQFMFTSKREQVFLERKVLVESLPSASIPYPPPLEEGMPLDLYERFIEPPATIEPLDEAIQVDKIVEDNDIGDATVKPEVEEDVLSTLQPDTIRSIVADVSNTKITEFQAEYRKKLKDKEALLTTKMAKLTVKWPT